MKVQLSKICVCVKLHSVRNGTYFSGEKSLKISHEVKSSFLFRKLSTEGNGENMSITSFYEHEVLQSIINHLELGVLL